MAVGVQEHQVGLMIRAALGLCQDVMDMPSGFHGDRLTAVRTSLLLCLPETEQPLPPFEAVLHHLAEPLFEVRLPGGVEGVRLALDLDVALDRRVAGMRQFGPLHLAVGSSDLGAEHPVA